MITAANVVKIIYYVLIMTCSNSYYCIIKLTNPIEEIIERLQQTRKYDKITSL